MKKYEIKEPLVIQHPIFDIKISLASIEISDDLKNIKFNAAVGYYGRDLVGFIQAPGTQPKSELGLICFSTHCCEVYGMKDYRYPEDEHPIEFYLARAKAAKLLTEDTYQFIRQEVRLLIAESRQQPVEVFTYQTFSELLPTVDEDNEVSIEMTSRSRTLTPSWERRGTEQEMLKKSQETANTLSPQKHRSRDDMACCRCF